jgi:hypothetical protein
MFDDRRGRRSIFGLFAACDLYRHVRCLSIDASVHGRHSVFLTPRCMFCFSV